jgi:hypothetical protein
MGRVMDDGNWFLYRLAGLATPQGGGRRIGFGGHRCLRPNQRNR